MPDLGQQRSAHAWHCVQQCGKDYTSLAKSAPALIINNGLMQTMAFYEGKNKEHHKQLLKHIITWLKGRFAGITVADFSHTMQFFCSASSAEYRRATEEVLELLRWIRQFAPAVSGDMTSDD
jgi:CRISPR-associated protein Cmr5